MKARVAEHVELLSGPRREERFPGEVVFDLRVGGVTLLAGIDQGHVVWAGLEGQLHSEDLCLAGMNFAHGFNWEHPVAVSHLLSQARSLAGGAIFERYADGTSLEFRSVAVRGPAELAEDGALVLTIELAADRMLAVVVDPSLWVRSLHYAEEIALERHEELPARDAALAYMIGHVAELESLGFDTTYLKEQMRDARRFPGCEDIPDPDG